MSAPAREAGPRREPPCVLGPGARFEGLLVFDGEARVAGELAGEVEAGGTLYVDEGGVVRGPIRVDALVVAGRVEGPVVAAERVELLAGSELVGAVHTPRLVMSEGAHLDGELRIGGADAEAGGAAPRPEAP